MLTPALAQEWLGVLAQLLLLVGVAATVFIQLRIYAALQGQHEILHKVVEQTNGMSHRLEQLAGDAGEQRGRAAERASERAGRP